MATDHPLKAFRKNQVPPLSQGELAGQIGVVRETVARWESGTRQIDEVLLPKVSKLTRIPPHVLRPDLAERAALFAEPAE